MPVHGHALVSSTPLSYTQSYTLQPRSLAAPRYAVMLQDQLEFLHLVQEFQLRYPGSAVSMSVWYPMTWVVRWGDRGDGRVVEGVESMEVASSKERLGDIRMMNSPAKLFWRYDTLPDFPQILGS